MEKNIEDLRGKPMYGLIENGLFGSRIISGIVTGVRYTEDNPVWEISFDKNSWWTSEIADKQEDVVKLLKLVPLERVKETHNLKKKYA